MPGYQLGRNTLGIEAYPDQCDQLDGCDVNRG